MFGWDVWGVAWGDVAQLPSDEGEVWRKGLVLTSPFVQLPLPTHPIFAEKALYLRDRDSWEAHEAVKQSRADIQVQVSPSKVWA